VSDLRADSVGATTLLLRWTAPGDDGDEGQAARYDLRAAVDSGQTGDFWPGAIPVATSAPRSAGAAEEARIEGLAPESDYLFALKAADSDSNWSEISNVLPVRTAPLPDTIPPARILDLQVDWTGSTVAALTWTATGDDGRQGVATAYEVRYSTFELNETTWAMAESLAVADPPSPPGLGERFLVRSLAPSTVYFFAVKAIDEAGLYSGISLVAAGQTRTNAAYSAPSADFPTIGAALEVTIRGDTVLVEPGRHEESLQVPAGRSLLSRSGWEATVLDAGGRPAGITLQRGCLLAGLTVQGSDGSGADAGGVACLQDSCFIRDCHMLLNNQGLFLRESCRAEDCILAANEVGLVGHSLRDTLRDLTVESNNVGMELLARGLVLERCAVRQNGRGIQFTGDSLALSGCQVEENRTGGVTGDGKLKVAFSTITRNGIGPSGTEVITGGIAVTSGPIEIESCLISYNQRRDDGGGIACINCEGTQRIARSAILGNLTQRSGGGLSLDGGRSNVFDCRISGNEAWHDGGGFAGSGPIFLEGCLVSGNLAGREGGGIHTGNLGLVRSCTIAGNRAAVEGGGLLIDGGEAPLENCILFGNCADTLLADAYLRRGAELRLTCSAINRAGLRTDGSAGSEIIDAGVQVESDPGLLAPASCALAPTVSGDYRLRSDSPCLPAASPCGEPIGAFGLLFQGHWDPGPQSSR